MRNIKITTILAIVAIIVAVGTVVLVGTTVVNNEMAYASKGNHHGGKGDISGSEKNEVRTECKFTRIFQVCASS